MNKVIMDLTTINRNLRIKFGLVLKGDKEDDGNIVSPFEINGNNYLMLRPRPFITIDISDKKNKEWNPNQSFNISGFNKYLFTKRLKELRKRLNEEKDLFFISSNGKLTVNKNNPSFLRASIVISVNGKVCKFVPVVVEDDYTNDQFEGVCMMINTPANYANLTFEELEYMISYIDNLDLENLSMSVLNFISNKK